MCLLQLYNNLCLKKCNEAQVLWSGAADSEAEQTEGGLVRVYWLWVSCSRYLKVHIVALTSGMCFVHSPGGLDWKACQQGVQRFGCSPDRRYRCESRDEVKLNEHLNLLNYTYQAHSCIHALWVGTSSFQMFVMSKSALNVHLKQILWAFVAAAVPIESKLFLECKNAKRLPEFEEMQISVPSVKRENCVHTFVPVLLIWLRAGSVSWRVFLKEWNSDVSHCPCVPWFNFQNWALCIITVSFINHNEKKCVSWINCVFLYI